MTTIDSENALERLMADESLMSLCELQRTGDEIFDVISLSENQHSDILGWLLDPREGHGQGDQILRDLLIAASMKAASGDSGLDGRLTTARFFKAWQPSRIRTTSFGSAFYARELGMKASERVDLFVIDPQNRFVLLIENKAGAAHHEVQLQQYRESFLETVASNSHLQDYDHVYIALDRDYESDSAESRPCSDSWIHLGYDWLKTSASRALLHLSRGNASAKLVVSYCNRQSDWESPEAKQCVGLAADLHQRHPEAIEALLKVSTGRAEKEWLHAKKSSSSLLFVLQNKSVIELLRETKGMASVKFELQARLPSIPDSSIEHTRTWLNICPPGWERADGEWWPLYIHIRFVDNTKSKFVLCLVQNSAGSSSVAEAQALRKQLMKIEPRFGTFNESQRRSVTIETGLSLTELPKKVEELSAKLKRISSHP